CDEHREFKDMKLLYRFRKDDGTFPLDSEAKVFMRGQRIYEKDCSIQLSIQRVRTSLNLEGLTKQVYWKICLSWCREMTRLTSNSLHPKVSPFFSWWSGRPSSPQQSSSPQHSCEAGSPLPLPSSCYDSAASGSQAMVLSLSAQPQAF
ncbi:hypothetical protein AMECASPLE_033037, partial [Ameca splendens]